MYAMDLQLRNKQLNALGNWLMNDRNNRVVWFAHFVNRVRSILAQNPFGGTSASKLVQDTSHYPAGMCLFVCSLSSSPACCCPLALAVRSLQRLCFLAQSPSTSCTRTS